MTRFSAKLRIIRARWLAMMRKHAPDVLRTATTEDWSAEEVQALAASS
jgi:hypothetical protein